MIVDIYLYQIVAYEMIRTVICNINGAHEPMKISGLLLINILWKFQVYHIQILHIPMKTFANDLNTLKKYLNLQQTKIGKKLMNR